MVGVAIFALVAVLGVVGLVQRSSKTHVLTESQLVAGDCLVGSNMGLHTNSAWPDTVTAVSCTQQHIAEVFYVGNPWPASLAKYPGDGVVNTTINATCSTAFATYVGIKPDLSMYQYDEVGPSGDWASGDREVVCVAYEPGTPPLHRSIKGSGQ
jgi:Septum formation